MGDIGAQPRERVARPMAAGHRGAGGEAVGEGGGEGWAVARMRGEVGGEVRWVRGVHGADCSAIVRWAAIGRWAVTRSRLGSIHAAGWTRTPPLQNLGIPELR